MPPVFFFLKYMLGAFLHGQASNEYSSEKGLSQGRQGQCYIMLFLLCKNVSRMAAYIEGHCW